MSTVFGEVAELYDEVRPPYPDELAAFIAEFAQPPSVTEIASGTGHGTRILARLGVPLTGVEPDARMAAVLRSRFPAAHVVISKFEDWTPPAGGVPLLACALAWHWIEAERRCRLAADALAPGGALVVLGNYYGFVDEGQKRALDAAFADGRAHTHDRGWIQREITDSGLFDQVTVHVLTQDVGYPTERYLRLVQTFGSFRQRAPDEQAATLERVRVAVDGFGGRLDMRLDTTLVLARKRSQPA